jgi:hypothetical protein
VPDIKTSFLKKSFTLIAENIEPDVERALTVALIDPPGPFDGQLKPSQLELLKNEPGIVDILVGLDRLEQGQDWLIQQTLNSNRQRRRLEAEIIRLRRQLQEERVIREERERAVLDQSKIELWPLFKKVLIWALTVGAATLLGIKLLH